MSTVTGISPQLISSRNTLPAPTLCSWSASPTSSTFVSGPMREKNFRASHISIMDDSSTMIRPASSISSSPFRKPPSSPNSPRRLCSVLALFTPVLSAIRRLARPVGAASRIFSDGFSSLNTSMTAFRTVVLPVPGEPVMMDRSLRNTM